MNARLKQIIGRISFYIGVATFALFCGFPMIWMVLTSIKPDRDILTSTPVFWSWDVHLDHYRSLFDQTDFLIYFVNSITVAASATSLTIVIATLAAYGITRFRFTGREYIAAGMLFTYMFAPILIVVPFYILMKNYGLINTKLGLVLAYTTFSLPFSMWLLRSFFQSIPLDLEEAAMTDGASRPQAVIRVIVPLAFPGVIAVSIFTFIVAWNDYLFARVLVSDNLMKTLPIGMNDLYNATITDWGMMMAGGVVVTVPALVFFIMIQRYLISGWGAGAIKG